MGRSRIFRDDLLSSQVAIITGGGTGIGVAIARELASLGAQVVIASRKAENIEPAAKGLTEELGLAGTGREIVGLVCDIRDKDATDALARETMSRFGRIDVLVNNGGGQFFSPAEMITPKGFDAVVSTNLTGTWNMTRSVADATMLAHGGTILHITMLTKGAFPGMSHSVAARAGVEAMTRTLAVEWAQRDIRINAIAPGFVASSGIKRYPAGLGIVEQMKSLVPFKRLATCEEIAWLTAYLASEAGRYITGQVLTIDGGKELWGSWWPIPDPPGMTPVEIPKEPWER